MKKLILTTLFFFFLLLTAKPQELAEGELSINIINNPQQKPVIISLQLISSLCWDASIYSVYEHNLTDLFTGYTFPPATSGLKEFHACWDPNLPPGYEERKFGLGLYKVTASYDDLEYRISFLIDYRTSDLPENFNTGGPGDVVVDFDVTALKLYYYNTQNEFPSSTAIWGKEWIDHITTELEPLPPEDLYWYNFFNYPRLEWSHSSNPDDYVTDYEVHRYTGGQEWDLIATRPARFPFYVDWEIDLGAPEQYEYLFYKIRSKNGDRVSDEFSNTVIIYSPGNFGKQSDGINSEAEKKYEFKLEQNYPNPFNPSTRITFSLRENSLVTLKIYDILGKEITVLVNEVLGAGNHQVEFNGSNLESGIYFYEIRANNFRDVKKLILLK
jgi:hypothetical protein